MQRHGSLKSYNCLLKVEMLVINLKSISSLRKPKEIAHCKVAFFLFLIFDDFGLGSKYVCPLFQFFVGRRSFLRTFIGQILDFRYLSKLGPTPHEEVTKQNAFKGGEYHMLFTGMFRLRQNVSCSQYCSLSLPIFA